MHTEGGPDDLDPRDLMPPLLLAATALAMGYLLLPFYGAIMWAIITAMLFVPLYRRLLPRVKGRRNAAAALVMLIVLLGCVLPFALITLRWPARRRSSTNTSTRVSGGRRFICAACSTRCLQVWRRCWSALEWSISKRCKLKSPAPWRRAVGSSPRRRLALV